MAFQVYKGDAPLELVEPFDVEPQTVDAEPVDLGEPFDDAPTRGRRSSRMTPVAEVAAAVVDQFRFEEPVDLPADVAGGALIQVAPLTSHEQAPQLAEQLTAFLVVDAKTYEAAAELLKVGASGLKVIDEFFDANIARAHAAHKGLTTQKAKYANPLKAAVDALKGRAMGWWQEAERQRQEAQRKADAEAAAERRRQEEAAAAEARRLEDEAKQLAAQGNLRAALELEQQAAEVVDEVQQAPASFAPPVQSIAPKVAGVAPRSNWTYRITDKKAFVKAVADGTISLDAIPDEGNAVYLRQRAKADKNTLRWPGVEFYDAGSMAVRR